MNHTGSHFTFALCLAGCLLLTFTQEKVSRACEDVRWPGSQLYSHLYSQLVPASVLCCSPGHLDSRRLQTRHSKALLSLLADQFLLCAVYSLFSNTNSASFHSFPPPSASTWIKWKWRRHLQMKGKCGVKWQVKVSWHKWDRLSYDSAFSRGTLSVIIEKANECRFLSPHFLVFDKYCQKTE